MSEGGTPKVAVIGMGEVGRGWAALLVSAGWPTAIFDTDATALGKGQDDVMRRVDSLVAAGRAERAAADLGLSELRSGRSLLQTVGEADWIIECLPEDLSLKQRTLEQLEQVARMRAVITSSTAGLFASQLCGRLRNPGRLLVANPMVPVELMPLVEVVPGPKTDAEALELARHWIRTLGRVPIVLHKEVSGHVVGRLTAALWREAIQLVLDGVVDVQTLDAAVQLGPGLAWSASGPHLMRAIGSGKGSIAQHVAQRLVGFEERWRQIAKWESLTPEDAHKLQKGIEKAYTGRTDDLRTARDERLIKLLQIADEGPTGGWPGDLTIVRPPEPR
ncbi:MAG TPA: 3-hydroxyacyl-CoA dehydrogenase family protein [Gemmatimonadales bacterium]|nr:3-hydroxyacyl-CoA dehydrogenase family protein [Gemmatimonadales bacterium]